MQFFIILFKKLSHVHMVPVKTIVLSDELYLLFCCGSTQNVINIVHIYWKMFFLLLFFFPWKSLSHKDIFVCCGKITSEGLLLFSIVFNRKSGGKKRTTQRNSNFSFPNIKLCRDPDLMLAIHLGYTLKYNFENLPNSWKRLPWLPVPKGTAKGVGVRLYYILLEFYRFSN